MSTMELENPPEPRELDGGGIVAVAEPLCTKGVSTNDRRPRIPLVYETECV